MATEITGIDSSAARAEVLRRIRAANGGAADGAQAAQQWREIQRDYRREASLSREQLVDLLEDRLRDYDAHVVRTTESAIADAVAKMLGARGLRRILIPQGLNPVWLPAGVEFVVDGQASYTELDGFEGVMTASTCAIAITGSVVLQNVPGQGRRAASLIPDYHLCLVRVEDVVETVPEAIVRLEKSAELPTTFFAGPSATADIEMTRIKGVHGPRFLDVILVG
ncbi:LutC/YkgG family protein [Edaphobacter albus]|uniref:LutC/YkgG family protein n=1 Tax=Edaphobacter sp. 4G125 TaxID=2763071 RepID=UPI001647FC44|nr:LUD domain-containing protein [Edaphobacter sp. 4G125]QNI35768.1 LUD domain-containing protein [Edaphobacter sp. 4G125]